MKRKLRRMPDHAAGVVFRPAITPLEASVLPALEKTAYGALSMVRRAYDAGGKSADAHAAQRAKIWVR